MLELLGHLGLCFLSTMSMREKHNGESIDPIKDNSVFKWDTPY
jgi:hypothetical protein